MTTARTAATWPPPQQNDNAPLARGEDHTENNETPNHTTTKPAHKWRRVLAAFAAGGNYNTFEAARSLHDTCLHSTVAGLSARGLVFQREEETVAGRYGEARVMRYRLDPLSYAFARELLSGAPAAIKGADGA